jgi:hypothetical protein
MFQGKNISLSMKVLILITSPCPVFGTWAAEADACGAVAEEQAIGDGKCKVSG